MNFGPVASVQSSGELDVNAYCENKFRSLSQSELQTLGKVGEESITQIHGGPSGSSGAAVLVYDENKAVAEKKVECTWVGHEQEL